jgi:hypothetical protein
MRLVTMRHPPAQIEKQSVPVPLCQSLPYCQEGDNCPAAHSTVEYDTWDFIRTLFKDKHLKELLRCSKLVPQCPSRDVCMKCYRTTAPSNSTRWLTWLECGQLPDHKDEERMTLIVGDDYNVTVARELPPHLYECHPLALPICKEFHLPGGCPGGYYCKEAHSIEELQYWKWGLIHKALEEFPRYLEMCEMYKYSSNEAVPSASQVELAQSLCRGNYTDKLHKLICLDELAHCRKMATL